jgi:hypothetical protein
LDSHRGSDLAQTVDHSKPTSGSSAQKTDRKKEFCDDAGA